MITLGYYAHFMPEPGSKGRSVIDGLLGVRGVGSSAETPRILPRVIDWRCQFPLSTEPSAKCKAEEMGGLGKCWKKS